MGKVISIEAQREVKILERLRERAGNLKPAFQAAIDAWRAVGSLEFDRESWNRPSGGYRAWPPTKEFGNEPPPSKTLQRTGALKAAYMGHGAGAIERIGETEAEFGVSGAVFPYAAVHRGGTIGRLLTADVAAPERIRVTPRMRRYLAAAKGVYLRKDTEFIEIPRRPHFTLNPEVRTRHAAIFAAWTSGREIPRELAA